MPQSGCNGYKNGHSATHYDMEDGAAFLFTSESVGEGHPGKIYTKIFYFNRLNLRNY